jgi:hypothetical protein
MISTGSFYNLDAIQKIMETEAPYSLSSSILNIIQELENEITATTDISKPRPREYNDTPTKKQSNHGRKMDEKWEMISSIKPNIMKISKEGFEKQLSDLRSALNKLSTKTYDTLKIKIVEQVKEIMDEDRDENVQKIVEFIFDTAISNKFYSELYSQLYKELIDLFGVFKDVIDPFLKQYTDSIHTICIVDQNEDYNGFCENNKKNEKRKATTVFMANLLKHEVIAETVVVDMIVAMQELSEKYIEEENRKPEVEEITENLFLLISSSPSSLKNADVWQAKIEPDLRKFAAYKSKDKISLSNRVVFKYMDIVEKHL